MPADEAWLSNLVAMLDHFPDVAGAFGKHLAWPTASAFARRDIDAHFAQFSAKRPLRVHRDLDRTRYAGGDESWHQFLHYYSDNNSCLRKSVWQDIPYRDVEYGEDQLFARDVIAAGYAKAYAPSASVFHSHDYDAEETLARSETEARFFHEHFGYILVPDDVAMRKTLSALNESDRKWGAEHQVGPQEIDHQLRLNEARLKGYLAGYRNAVDTAKRRGANA
jgi:hypothetical protein